MSNKALRWQQDSKRAFDWIAKIYDAAHLAWEDAEAYYDEAGWEIESGGGMGGCTAATKLSEWPFAYLKVMTATPPGTSSSDDSGTAAVFGFLFYDSVRDGPVCFGGTVRWSKSDAICDHQAFYAAFGSPGYWQGTFELTGTTVRTAVPNDRGRKFRPGVEEVRWFEVPLGTVDSADRLREIVMASQAMVKGDDALANSFCAPK